MTGMRFPRALAVAALVLGLASGCSSSPKPAAPLPPNSVLVANFAFTPAALTVPVGTTVTWVFRQKDSPHNVVSLTGPASFNSGSPQGSGTFTYTFTRPGTYTYDCQVHPNMTGTVTVTPS